MKTFKSIPLIFSAVVMILSVGPAHAGINWKGLYHPNYRQIEQLQVVGTFPADKAENVAINTPISVTFDHKIHADSLHCDTNDSKDCKIQMKVFALLGWVPVSAYVSLSPDGTTISLYPGSVNAAELMKKGGIYQVEIAKGIRGDNNSELNEDTAFSFTTEAPPAQNGDSNLDGAIENTVSDASQKSTPPAVVDYGVVAAPDKPALLFLQFSEPMNTNATSGAVSFFNVLEQALGKNGAVAGKWGWSSDHTKLMFKSDSPLPVGEYLLAVGTQAQAQNGAQMTIGFSVQFDVSPDLGAILKKF